jgi:hypothetical protein
VRERRLGMWKRLYLELRQEDEAAITDCIMRVIEHDDYRKHDELRFLFRKHWKSYLGSR